MSDTDDTVQRFTLDNGDTLYLRRGTPYAQVSKRSVDHLFPETRHLVHEGAVENLKQAWTLYLQQEHPRLKTMVAALEESASALAVCQRFVSIQDRSYVPVDVLSSIFRAMDKIRDALRGREP